MAEETNQWEYRVVSLGNVWSGPKEDELEALLNELGVEGWEVVGAFSVPVISKATNITLIAKRPLSAEGRQRSWPG